MQKSRLSCWIFCLLATTLNLHGQDFSYSQFYANRIYLNPAFTGIESGLTVTAISRLQWLNVDNGFQIYGVSAEIQEPYVNSGLGIQVYQSKEGLFDFKTTSVGFAYSYTIAASQRANVHIGLQSRWLRQSFNWDKIIFSDELDPVLGPIYSTAAIPLNDRISYFDVDMGIILRLDGKKTKSRGRTIRKPTRSHIGLAIHHLPGLFQDSGAEVSFLNLETRIMPRITLHAGQIITLNILKDTGHEVGISPNVRLDMQGRNLLKPAENLRIFSLGSYFLYNRMYLGVFFQNRLPFPNGTPNTETWSFMLGTYLSADKNKNRTIPPLFVGFSIDYNRTGVGTSAGSVYEVALRYNFADAPNLFQAGKPNSSKRILDCTSFF